MENLLARLESLPSYKELLKESCKTNGIKVSFLITMTLSRAKSIYKKLILTYTKGYGKTNTRWLQNELRLFHFALIAVSVIEGRKISHFNQQQWLILNQAFPNKNRSLLEYEGIYFVTTKSDFKRKWSDQEDKLLSQIIAQDKEDPKWNQIATQLFIKSDRIFFRNGKQCRERWLNHLDDSIRHEKWTDEEDKVLIKNVMENGKKWSYIMKCLENKRTQHMIKNRFLSLILKCKKNYPYITEEENAIKKISGEMGLSEPQKTPEFDSVRMSRRLKNKENRVLMDQVQSQNEEEDKEKNEDINGPEEGENLGHIFRSWYDPEHQPQRINQRDINTQNEGFRLQEGLLQNQTENFVKFSPTINSLPTPSAFMSPLSPFMSCNSFINSLNYFQWCMNNLGNQNPFNGNK